MDEIGAQPEALLKSGQTLSAVSQRMGASAAEIKAEFDRHDPSSGGGDEVGRAIGSKYFDSCRKLTDAHDGYARLLAALAQMFGAAGEATSRDEVLRVMASLNSTGSAPSDATDLDYRSAPFQSGRH